MTPALIRCVVLTALLLMPLAPAGARPHGPGVIRGQVVDGATGTPVAGVDVDLVSSLPGGEDNFSTTTTSDARGRYTFARLPTGDDRVYALRILRGGGIFAGRSIDELGASPRRTVVDTQLRVWDTISDPAAMLVQRHNIFVSQSEDGLGVIESLTIFNTSDSAYIGRAQSFGRKLAQSTFAFAVPNGSRDGRMLSESDFFGTPITATDSGFGLRVAIPPGEWRVMFAYRLTGNAGSYDLSRTALYPTLNTAVHLSEALSAESNRLSDAGEITVGNTRYARWVSDDVIEAGDSIQIAVTAQADPSSLLTAGLVAGALVVTALFALVILRNRRRAALPAPQSPESKSREKLVAAVAALDLQHDAGAIDDDEWTARRAELKSDLTRVSASATSDHPAEQSGDNAIGNTTIR